jgi:hypothetical protein
MRGEPLPETSVLTAFQRFELQDGILGLMWPEKYAAAVLPAERQKTKGFWLNPF